MNDNSLQFVEQRMCEWALGAFTRQETIWLIHVIHNYAHDGLFVTQGVSNAVRIFLSFYHKQPSSMKQIDLP